VIGVDADGDGRGEPVATYRKPKVLKPQAVAVPQTSDDFTGELSLAWQWHANPQDDWMTLSAAPGFLRLKSVSTPADLYEAGSLLTQKFPAPAFTVTTKLNFAPVRVGEQAGLLVIGTDYSWIGLRKTPAGLRLVQIARKGATEIEVAGRDDMAPEIYLRFSVEPVTVTEKAPDRPHWPSELRSVHAKVRFSYSADGKDFVALSSEAFQTNPGRWVGATFGVFSSAASGTPAYVATSVGYADFDYVQVTRR
jgi:beta-xylosidase